MGKTDDATKVPGGSDRTVVVAHSIDVHCM